MNIIKILRPHQWVKNTFVFIPLFFGGSLFDAADWIASAIAFFAFCMAASTIYCLNDIIDVEADRRHEKKCHRPIAAGLVSKTEAYILAAVLAVVALGVPYIYNKVLAVVIAIYLMMNVAYCLRLKQYAIIDVCIIASGFVLRILAGGYATDVQLSKWIVLMTFLLTLFLAFAKRRDDVLRMNTTGQAPRANTSRYNLTFINQAITITAGVMLVCYVMYTVSPEIIAQFATDKLYLTSILVILAILRYLQISFVDEKSGDPVKVALSDRATQLILLAWLLSFLVIIYL